MLPPDEEVEKEAHPKDGARIEGGSQESSLLPIRALQSLVQTRGMVACRRSGGEEGGREGGREEETHSEKLQLFVHSNPVQRVEISFVYEISG